MNATTLYFDAEEVREHFHETSHQERVDALTDDQINEASTQALDNSRAFWEAHQRLMETILDLASPATPPSS